MPLGNGRLDLPPRFDDFNLELELSGLRLCSNGAGFDWLVSLFERNASLAIIFSLDDRDNFDFELDFEVRGAALS